MLGINTFFTDEIVDIIVPVHIEEEILQFFYDRVRKLDLAINFLFIDNASTDRSLTY